LIYGSNPEAIECFVFLILKRQNLRVNVVKTVGVHAEVKYEFDIGKGFEMGFN
jgi:hypothetical protein